MLKIVDDQRVHEALSKLQFYTQRMSQHMVVNIYGDDDDTDGDDDVDNDEDDDDDTDEDDDDDNDEDDDDDNDEYDDDDNDDDDY